MAEQNKGTCVFSDPLVLACQNGHYSTAKKLLNGGSVNVNSRDGDGTTPLMWACLYGWMTIVVMLFSRGAEVNMQDSKGWSALMMASQRGHSNVVNILIDKGAEMNVQNNNGSSALMKASQNGHSNVVKILIEKGAEVNKRNIKGISALMAASQRGHSDVIRILIEKGAEVNMLNNIGVTALIVASGNGRKKVVQMLLDHHADTSIQTVTGKTALDWAHENRYVEIIHLLLSFVRVDGSASSRFVVSASPSVETDVTSGNTHESPTSGSPTITSASSSGHPNQHDHVTTGLESVNIIKDPTFELSLVTLYKELDTVIKPIKLGVGLGVAQHHLEIIQRNHPQDIEQQKHEVFSFVSKNSLTLEITWEKIADTLEHFMSMGNLAHNIRRKFNLQTSVIESEGKQATAAMEYSNKEYISHDMVIFTNQQIGSGAFGEVFKGEVNGQPCAIKLLHSLASEIQLQIPFTSRADSSERFRKECEFLESFCHPNIVRHLATREHPRTRHLVLALELMDCNLRHYFTPQPDKEPLKLALPAQSSLCHNIASALEYIHSRGVVHRDLCGENILLSCGGEAPVAKVCDFGMSKITKSDTRSVSHILSRKGFMPPEATDMESSCYNSSFDIYSFGALMVQIVCHLPTIKDRRERKRELRLIPEDHPIKELIVDCLNDNRDDRPSAVHLKRRLSNNTSSVAKTKRSNSPSPAPQVKRIRLDSTSVNSN